MNGQGWCVFPKNEHTNSSGLACGLLWTYSTMLPFFIHGEIKQNSATSLEMPKNGRMFLCVSRFQRTASLQNLCEWRGRWVIRGSKQFWVPAYLSYLVVISAPCSYFENLNRNRLLPVGPPPGFRNNASLLRYRFVSRHTREDVRCWYDPILATNPAEMGQGFTLQFNVQLLISIQHLEGGGVQLEVIDGMIEGGLMYARDNIGEFLSALLR